MKKLLMASLVLAILSGCSPIRTVYNIPMRKIEVGMGPEDMVVDTVTSAPRLLISCSDRRNHPPIWSGVVAYSLETGAVDTLERVGEPEGLDFRPHGIALQTVAGRQLLYVVSHPKSPEEKEPQHPIHVYLVEKETLTFQKTYRSPLFRSPNAVLAREDGSFYVSNDAWKRGSLMEMLLKKKKAQLVFCDADGNCRVEEDRVSYGNGLAMRDGFLYQASTRGNLIYRYKVAKDGSLSGKVVVCKKITGADNLRFSGDRLLVAGHPRPLAFIGHAKSPEKYSPSMISSFVPGEFDPEEGPLKPTEVFADDGKRISASSTAVIWKGMLYISQVFQPYILKVEINP